MQIEIIKELAQLGGLVLIAVPTITLLYKYFNDKIGSKNETLSPLNHNFFTHISYQKSQLRSLRMYHKGVYSPNRTKLVKKILDIKFKIWRDIVKEALSKNYEKLEKDELFLFFTQINTDIVKKYEGKWKEDNVPAIFIDRFNEWHSPHIEMFTQVIQNICNGNVFATTKAQVNAVLELYSALLIMTLTDVERTLGDLNGDLSKHFKELD